MLFEIKARVDYLIKFGMSLFTQSNKPLCAMAHLLMAYTYFPINTIHDNTYSVLYLLCVVPFTIHLCGSTDNVYQGIDLWYVNVPNKGIII